jgi:hypothetical protein
MATRPVVYRLPETTRVRVTRDVIYRRGQHGPLGLDVYSPAAAAPDTRLPAVVFAIGYSDLGAVPRFGCVFKEVESYVTWAQLVAASGMVGITYQNEDPAPDLGAVLDHIQTSGVVLGVDPSRIGLWACSGNAPVALSRLMRDATPAVACAAFCYGLMLDGKDEWVSQAAKAFGFAHPCIGRTAADLAPDVPLFIVRAGKDEIPHLNETIDEFVANALARNLPLTLVNHTTAPHAFDVLDDTDATRDVIERLLAFFSFNLREKRAALR